MKKKTAVVLLNLGGPDKPESIRPFLINFFMDKNIIKAPYPIRYFISRMIANKRSKNEAGSAYAKLGGKSPLLENTLKQAGAIQGKLGPDFRVFVCMRYWHPMAEEVTKLVKDYAPDQIVLIPLYPQYSTTTTRSSFEDWNKAAAKNNLKVPTKRLCCYPDNEGFIEASAKNIQTKYEDLKNRTGQKPRLLFSAHGLPEKIIKAGDPYQYQCEESARLIAEKLQIRDLDWSICYQSRVGPLKWIGPSTEEALEDAAKAKVPVLIYPHAFVSEHVETLVEIEEEYRDLAKNLGIPAFERVETVGTSENFIKALAEKIKKMAEGQAPKESGTLCLMRFSKCCHNETDRLGICSR
ncbi:MAG TPA: ferrochelatase [Alphaproteobacteria bacterium]|nr:ferrochelatase [Alphaproteobacteria bacterium]HOO50429.1 ferrochelatase [Alphaproteobacteria bacterium]